MCYLLPFNIKTQRLFREKCYDLTNLGLYEEEMKEAFGNVIIKCSSFFTADVQPIYTEKVLANAIYQYGSEGVILVRDDDYPDLELPEWCSSNLLPSGFKKAAALSEILHADNIKNLGIKEGDEHNKYIPIQPYIAYLKSIGRRMTVGEFALMYVRKMLNSKFFDALLSFLGYIFLYAVGGAVLSGFFEVHPLAGVCGGTVLGVFYWLLELFDTYVLNPE